MIIYDKPQQLLQLVTLSEPELLSISKELGEGVQKLNELEEEKRQVTKDYGQRVLAQEFVVNQLAEISATGKDERPVECQWEYHQPSDGIKSLRRLDTMDIVETRDMTNRDYERIDSLSQLELNLV